MKTNEAPGRGGGWKGFAGPVAVVTLLALVAKGFGFVEKLVLAYFAGTGSTVDAYFTAFNLTFMCFVVIDDIVVPVFLVQHVLLRQKLDEAASRALSRSVLMAVFVALGLLVGLVEIRPEPIVRLLAPGFGPESIRQTVVLLRWMLPGGLFLGLSAVTYAALNARERFTRPAASSALYKITVVAGIAVLYPWMGVGGIGVAILLGALAQFLFQLSGLREHLWPGHGSPGASAATVLPEGQWRTMLILMAPLAVGTLAAQTDVFVANAMGSILKTGSIAALGFARRLVELPILMVPTALGIVSFPRLTRLASEAGSDAMMRLLRDLGVFSLMVFLPLSIVLALTPETFVTLVFARGKFDASSVAVTSLVLRCYAFGLTAYAVEILIQRAFYATMDTRTPIVVGLIMLAINVALTIGLTPRWGIAVIPLALSLQKTLKVIVLCGILLRRYRGGWSAGLGTQLLKIGLCAALFGAVFALVAPLRSVLPWTGKPAVAGALLAAGVSAASVYALALSRMRLVSFAALWSPLRAKFFPDTDA